MAWHFTQRDDGFRAQDYDERHDELTVQVAISLPAPEAIHCTKSIQFGNYPELSPEETASAALDGCIDQRLAMRKARTWPRFIWQTFAPASP